MHLKRFRKAHPKLSLKDAMIGAKKTYGKIDKDLRSMARSLNPKKKKKAKLSKIQQHARKMMVDTSPKPKDPKQLYIKKLERHAKKLLAEPAGPIETTDPELLELAEMAGLKRKPQRPKALSKRSKHAMKMLADLQN